MRKIKSKYDFSKATFPAFLLLFINSFFIGRFIMNVNFSRLNENVLSEIIFGTVLVGIYDYFAIIYIIYAYPIININNEKIIINNFVSKKEIDFKNIKNINLKGEKSIRFIVRSFFADAIMIECVNGNKYYIIADNYRNIKELRQFISTSFNNTTQMDFEIAPIFEDSGELISLNKWGIFVMHFWFLVILSGYLIKLRLSLQLSIIFFIPSIFMLIYSLRMVSYIQYNDNFIVIRNNINPWYKKVFSLNDIINVAFHSYGRGPSTITIMLKDFTKVRYVIESVGDKNKQILIKFLKQKNIEVDGY